MFRSSWVLFVMGLPPSLLEYAPVNTEVAGNSPFPRTTLSNRRIEDAIEKETLGGGPAGLISPRLISSNQLQLALFSSIYIHRLK